MQGVSIVVVRIGGRYSSKNVVTGNTSRILKNSKPCMHCIEFMKLIGLKKIWYSNGVDNEFIREHINTISTDHMTIAHRALIR